MYIGVLDRLVDAGGLMAWADLLDANSDKRGTARWMVGQLIASAEYLAIRLETGRTHQVRVHLRALGHPVVGDPIYAPRWERGFVGAGGHWAQEFTRRCGRMFLHAARLVFRHPRTGEEMDFTSPLPEPLRSAAQWASRP